MRVEIGGNRYANEIAESSPKRIVSIRSIFSFLIFRKVVHTIRGNHFCS